MDEHVPPVIGIIVIVPMLVILWVTMIVICRMAWRDFFDDLDTDLRPYHRSYLAHGPRRYFLYRLRNRGVAT